MPFAVTLEPGEELVFNETYSFAKRSEPFAFAVSSRAIFLPRKKTFAMKDPWYFQRVPLSEVRMVALKRLRPSAMVALSALMIAIGLLTTYWMLTTRAQGGRLSGYPIGVFLSGLILPFAARGRYTLIIGLNSGSFKWRPRATVRNTEKVQAVAIQEKILEACRKVGILVSDERAVA